MNDCSRIVIDFLCQRNGMRSAYANVAGAFQSDLRIAMMNALMREEDSRSREEAAAWFRGEIAPNSPARVPDAYSIHQWRKVITWVEVDDWHPTSAEKISDLARFHDCIRGYGWRVTIAVYKIRPIPALIVMQDATSEDMWQFQSMRHTAIPAAIMRLLWARNEMKLAERKLAA